MTPTRSRREPPRFRRVEVARLEELSPFMTLITLAGVDLEGLEPPLPAASVRLLLPTADTHLVLPTWNGNEFLLEDGIRPTLRTLTPVRLDTARLELDIVIVRHGHGPLSAWAGTAEQGDQVAVSGTGRGYEIDPVARSFLLAGDESALPAITQVLEALPEEALVRVILEVNHLDARIELPDHPGATVQWHQLDNGALPGEALGGAVVGAALDPGSRVWAAGEAAAMQRIRRHLFDERELPRADVVVRGYWKHGRGA